MKRRTRDSVYLGNASFLLIAAVLGCGDSERAEPAASPARQAALTATQIQSARQAGLVTGYLEPTFFDPMENFAFDPTDPNIGTGATAINNAGTVVGLTNSGCAGLVCGNQGSPFFAPSTGSQTLLPNPYPAGPGLLIDINESGDMLALGGPGDDTRDFLHPFIYHADGTFQPLPLPVPDWLPLVPMWAYAINNDAPIGLSTVIGLAITVDAGALAVWHFDGDLTDAVGPSTLPAPPVTQFVAGHENSALAFDGSTCISMAPGNDTAPWGGPGFTLMAWVDPDPSMCPGGKRTVVRHTDQWGFGVTIGELSLTCNGDGTAALAGAAYAGRSNGTTPPAGTLPLGQWAHVAITTDSHSVRSYVNGVQVAEVASAGGLISGPPGLAVGCTPGDATTNFVGAIDEVSMFQNGLGPDQIHLYAEDKGSYPPAQPYYDPVRLQNGFFDVIMPPAVAGNAVDTRLYALNDQGMMVGDVYLQGAPAAHLFDPASGWKNLNDFLPADSGWDLQHATAINNAGQIVGWGTHEGVHAMFRLDAASGAIADLGHDTDAPFGDPSLNVVPKSINAAGHVAGATYDQYPMFPYRAFVYTDETGPTDLNDLMDPALAAAGWELRIVNSINDNDVVVGVAYNHASGMYRGFKADVSMLRGLPASSAVTPILLGIAQNTAGATKAIFTYTLTFPTPIQIPYGPQNSLSDQNGFIASPPQMPPQSFTAAAHAPFVATLAGTSLTWAVGVSSATATASSPDLSVETLPDGTKAADLPDGTKVNLDLGIPADPTSGQEPQVGEPFDGVLSGQLTVGPTGAASYTLPISIPPGLAGMAPSLTLAYNSQSGDGLAGQGWELGGLSMIHRCPRTRVKDGYARPVTMDSLDQPGDTDGLCIDGQELFETAPGSGTFVAEKKDFSQITRLSDGSFRVATKSGQTRSYGSPADSRPTANSRVDLFSSDVHTSPGETAIWALDRVSDQWGNYFDISYTHPSFPAFGLRVAEIDYTGHLGAGGTADVQPFASVKFDYEPRPDVRWTRFGPYKLTRDQRLKSITTPSGAYSLTYQVTPPGGVSLLQQIDYCVGSTCLKRPLQFGWQQSTQIDWVPNAGYAIPTTFDANTNWQGMQLIDLNGDARPELVSARAGGSWITMKNTGVGWEYWFNMPTPLRDWNGNPTGARFADVDGDGLPDLIHDHVDLVCNGDSCYFCASATPDPQLCPGTQVTISPAVWLNRLNSTGLWEFHREFDGQPAGWGQFPGDPRPQPIDFSRAQFDVNVPLYYDAPADIDGDGRVDIVRVQECPGCQGGTFTYIDVLLNKGPSVGGIVGGWSPLPRVTLTGVAGNFHIQDANRDGLSDLVSLLYHTYSDGTINTDEGILINRGLGGDGTISWQLTTSNAPSGVPGVTNLPRSSSFGDVDGDGFYDMVSYYPLGNAGSGDLASYAAGVGFGDGIGVGADQVGAAAYLQAVNLFSPKHDSGVTPDIVVPGDFEYALVDINADGLADLVRNHVNRTDVQVSDPHQANQGGGEVLLNTGLTWIDSNGVSGWQISAGAHRVPVVPNQVNGSAFVDLDGDGVLDLIQEANNDNGVTSKAWLNSYTPPVISQFPNGIADNKTAVNYATISQKEIQRVYSESYTLDPGTVYSPVPLRVVTTIQVDDGIGHLRETDYSYSDLRASALGYGPQGFKTMTVSEASGEITTTTYSQVYPYTGKPISVEKSNQGLVKETFTTYCFDGREPILCIQNPQVPTSYDPASSFPKSSFFVYPAQVTEVNYLRTSTFPEAVAANSVTTVSAAQYDEFGNALQSTLTTSGLGETYVTNTQTTYGTDGSLEQLMGKPTRTVVTKQRTAPSDGHNDPITHTVERDYGIVHGALAMTKQRTEPGASADTHVELHTAYDYDRFGNVITTTECASDFGACTPGALGPADLPFRTTTVSYDPSILGMQVGYSEGRFPVKTTNAAGHTELTVYDPLFGVVTRKTGPNGIATCYFHDLFGQPTQEIARCNSGSPLVTSTQRYLAPAVLGPPSPLGLARIVTVTRPPTGTPTWAFTDGLGRVTATLTRGFDGGIIEADTEYDRLGRVTRTSRPFSQGGAPAWTAMTYDPLGRVTTTAQDLGDVTNTGTTAQTEVDTSFLGATILTQQVVEGTAQDHFERKNAIGKVVYSTDDEGGAMSYFYDGDGNLSDTVDVNGNATHFVYDLRGHKIASRDPDMGVWSYGFDGYGDLVGQQDAKGQVTQMGYDVLGRLTSRTDPSGTARWVYDVAPGAGIGKLAVMIGTPDERLTGSCSLPFVTATDGKRPGRTYAYTPFGELAEQMDCTDGDTFVTSYQYDASGRQAQILYPAVQGARLTVGYHYTQLGYLQYLTDDSADYSVLWQATGMNTLGQVTRESTHSGVETVSNRDPATGWLLRSTSTAHANGDSVIQLWGYQYDEAGNVVERDGTNPNGEGTDEEFTYDTLNRLLTSSMGIGEREIINEAYDYDTLGNIRHKSGNAYTYGTCSAGPHAVCSVTGGTSYSYDGNGNMMQGGGRTITYTPANRPMTMENNSGAVDFMYGADGTRVVQMATTANSNNRTVYVGLGATGRSLYERTKSSDGTATHVHFIYAGSVHGGNPFALRLLTETAPTSMPTVATRYYHFDHLGSVTAMSDEQGRAMTGADTALLTYDPWGARRNADSSTATDPASLSLEAGHREFTGHETIPGLGLVNMNGRVYDAILGRFLSPDPNVQYMTDLQSWNRYSYVLNNPLRYTDPTGYFSWSSIGHFFENPLNDLNLLTGGLFCAGTAGMGCTGGIQAALFGELVTMPEGGPMGQSLIMTGFGLAEKALSGLGGGVEYVAHWGSHIPVIGGALVSYLATNAMTGAMWAIHDFKGWVRPAETGAVMDAATVLTIMSGGLSAPWMIAADTGIGFGEGYATAKINGANDGIAFKEGLLSAAISGGAAVLNAGVQSFKYQEYEYRLFHEPEELQVQSFTGTESAEYSPDGADPNAGWFNENGTFGHSSPGHWLSDVGYSPSHDGFARSVFDSWMLEDTGTAVHAIGPVLPFVDKVLTIATNLGPYPAVYFGSMAMAQYGGSGLIISDMTDQQ